MAAPWGLQQVAATRMRSDWVDGRCWRGRERIWFYHESISEELLSYDPSVKLKRSHPKIKTFHKEVFPSSPYLSRSGTLRFRRSDEFGPFEGERSNVLARPTLQCHLLLGSTTFHPIPSSRNWSQKWVPRGLDKYILLTGVIRPVAGSRTAEPGRERGAPGRDTGIEWPFFTRNHIPSWY